MVRGLCAGVLSLCLTGCMTGPNNAPGWPRDGAPVTDYDFNWRLSGDPMVAPLQVFSGAGRIWLQFAPGRTPPALFAQTPTGLQPLPYERQDPYVIVDGMWPVLIVRGGHQVARVEKQHMPHVSDVDDSGRGRGSRSAP
ncbi:Pilus assembly protein [Bordetella tumbae]